MSNGSSQQRQGDIPLEGSGARRRGISPASAAATTDHFTDNYGEDDRASGHAPYYQQNRRKNDPSPSIVDRIKQFLYSLTLPLNDYDDNDYGAKKRRLVLENGGSPSKFHEEKARSGQIPVPLAVLAWYLLGVVSITTTKILLTEPKASMTSSWDDDNVLLHIGGLNPQVLTVQQFSVGVVVLGISRYFRRNGGSSAAPDASSRVAQSRQLRNDRDLFLAGLYFSFGFLITNMSFRRGDAAFVETVKAAEPLTSAGTAVLFNIETLGGGEVVSLGGIVAGVVLSTFGHASGKSMGAAAAVATPNQSINEVAMTSLVVLSSNLCFSFCGLHQKVFRAKPRCGKDFVDDVQLQFRMQTIGLCFFSIPALLFYSLSIFERVVDISNKVGLARSGLLISYLGISIVNGLAFTAYNLASTYVLSRISVVHHAALNCIRRLFAIVVTSIAFGVPITLLSAIGILVSIGGFASFTHFKQEKTKRAQRSTSYLPLNSVPAS